jgi:hypothetical protein
MDPVASFHGHFPRPVSQTARLYLFHRDGAVGADFDTALAPQALIHVDGFGFAVFDLEYAGRAGVHAFTLAIAFVFVHGYLVHSFFFTPLYQLKSFFIGCAVKTL